MTRKDYVAIAEAFSEAVIHDDMWQRLRSKIADVFAADNPRFDRQRFYLACEEAE